MISPNLRKLDLNLLIVLDVLLQERHVSRTAEKLNMSQPAVSRALTKLREGFADPLLVRSGFGMVLTSRAEKLAAELKPVLRDLNQLVEPPEFDPKTDASLIRITGLDLEVGLYFPALIRYVRQHAPRMRFEVVRQQSDSFPMLERDEVHFSLSGLHPINAEHSLHRRLLAEVPVVCLMWNEHPLAHKAFTVKEYAAAPHGLVSITGHGPGSMDDVLAKVGLSRSVAVRLAGFTSVADFLEGTDLIFTLPKPLAERIAVGRDLVIRELPELIQQRPVKFYLYWHERYHQDPRIKWLRERLVTLIAEQNDTR
ncbi:LysR family transcriptional regulator [Aliidiomarina indica]|uniref:LysR family transcriptional regulator n=1 Tax=Aliidiomarina indica TaxID=2749147 RepID=UPI00188F6F2A|nr:LysR family transcriptional regulator [Aliidiomarina indica]